MRSKLYHLENGYVLHMDPNDSYPNASDEELLQSTGFLMQWAQDYAENHPKGSDVSLKDYMLDCYGMHMGEFEGKCVGYKFISNYEEDEDLNALVEFKYGDQCFTMYPYSIVHFGADNYITRMD